MPFPVSSGELTMYAPSLGSFCDTASIKPSEVTVMPFRVQTSLLYSVESMFVLTSHLRLMTCHGVLPSVSSVVVEPLSSPHSI